MKILNNVFNYIENKQIGIKDIFITLFAFLIIRNFFEIGYKNKEPGFVELTIYNQLGQPVDKLINQLQSEGIHKVIWNAADLPAGIYFYRLQAGDQSAVGKIILTR